MISCSTLSCASESVRKPMRLAGTCSRYSNSAIDQLRIAATYHGRSARLRKCAYHANVMNTFEQTRSRTVAMQADGRGGWCSSAATCRSALETTGSRGGIADSKAIDDVDDAVGFACDAGGRLACSGTV